MTIAELKYCQAAKSVCKFETEQYSEYSLHHEVGTGIPGDSPFKPLLFMDAVEVYCFIPGPGGTAQTSASQSRNRQDPASCSWELVYGKETLGLCRHRAGFENEHCGQKKSGMNSASTQATSGKDFRTSQPAEM